MPQCVALTCLLITHVLHNSCTVQCFLNASTMANIALTKEISGGWVNTVFQKQMKFMEYKAVLFHKPVTLTRVPLSFYMSVYHAVDSAL